MGLKKGGLSRGGGIYMLPSVFNVWKKKDENYQSSNNELLCGIVGELTSTYVKVTNRESEQVFFLVNQVENQKLKRVFGFQLGHQQTHSQIYTY